MILMEFSDFAAMESLHFVSSMRNDSSWWQGKCKSTRERFYKRPTHEFRVSLVMIEKTKVVSSKKIGDLANAHETHFALASLNYGHAFDAFRYYPWTIVAPLWKGGRWKRMFEKKKPFDTDLSLPSPIESRHFSPFCYRLKQPESVQNEKSYP